MTSSYTVCSKCIIVVTVQVDQTKKHFIMLSGLDAVDKAQDYLYQEHRVAYCMEGFYSLEAHSK